VPALASLPSGNLEHGLALLALGIFGRLIVGVTGVGGGSLMTPLLVLVFGVAPAPLSNGSAFAALTKTGGAWAHARRGNVAWNVVGWLAAARTASASLWCYCTCSCPIPASFRQL